MTKGYFRQAVAVILVYDTHDLYSLNKLSGWVEMAQETCVYKEHLIYALWGNDKGAYFSTADSPIEKYNLADFRKSLRSITIDDDLVCEMNGKEEEVVMENYERLVRKLDSKMQKIERKMKEASMKSRASEYETENEGGTHRPQQRRRTASQPTGDEPGDTTRLLEPAGVAVQRATGNGRGQTEGEGTTHRLGDEGETPKSGGGCSC